VAKPAKGGRFRGGKKDFFFATRQTPIPFLPPDFFVVS
jgi:hypothetical protein